MDETCRGILPLRVLLPLYPAEFCGDISDAEAKELLDLLKKQALYLLMDYLAKAEHSEFQCRNLLKRKQFEASIREETIARCRELGYLDNARFAEVLINSHIARRASKRAISAKLREQRIAPLIWEPLLEELYDKEEAADNLSLLLKKYCATHRGLEPQKLKEKAFTYLFRKGFDLGDIQAAWEDLGK
ncbi:MAG: RecX family transcriptional regulator [Candidatus Syntrophosphaera sp.]|nr:RecX family transcriptional regulator [Candidatus Syntrophosphaera sp.]